MFRHVYVYVSVTKLSETCTHLSISYCTGLAHLRHVTCYWSQMLANTLKCFRPLPPVTVESTETLNV